MLTMHENADMELEKARLEGLLLSAIPDIHILISDGHYELAAERLAAAIVENVAGPTQKLESINASNEDGIDDLALALYPTHPNESWDRSLKLIRGSLRIGFKAGYLSAISC